MKLRLATAAALVSLVQLQPVRLAGEPSARKDRHVVLVSLDGFPASALEDPGVPLPTLRRLAREGASARGMRVSNPSVTWPNHTTMVTGVPPARHGVLFNGMLVRPGPRVPVRVEPWRDKSEMVRVPTVYDHAYRGGLTTAQVDWVAIQNPGTITWAFPERPDPKGAVERALVAAGVIPAADVADFARLPITVRDEYWTRAAAAIVRRHRPNLLLFHVLNLDSTHHRYGPGTPAGTTAMAYADTRVEAILDALADAKILDRTTVLVVSDHGFRAYRRSIRPNALLREKGLVDAAGGSVACDAWVVPEGGTAMVYVTDPAKRGRLLPQLRSMLRSLEGVERVYEPTDFPGLGLPLPEEYAQMADLVLAAKEGYAFAGAHEGAPVVDLEGGAHGYPSSDPMMNALFVAWGRGIRKGTRLEIVDNLSIAPTIASLLGLSIEGMAGAPLTRILE